MAKITNHDRRFGPRREEEEKEGEEQKNPAMNFGFRVDADEFELKGELCSGTIWPRSDGTCDWAKIIVVLHKLCRTRLSPWA